MSGPDFAYIGFVAWTGMPDCEATRKAWSDPRDQASPKSWKRVADAILSAAARPVLAASTGAEGIATGDGLQRREDGLAPPVECETSGLGNQTAEPIHVMDWYSHYWADCSICGRMVVCGKCGNNCCNGAFGTLEDGSACDACESAYQMQNAGEVATEMNDLRTKLSAIVYDARIYPARGDSDEIAQKIIRAFVAQIECRWGLPMLAVRLLNDVGMADYAAEVAKRNRKRIVSGPTDGTP